MRPIFFGRALKFDPDEPTSLLHTAATPSMASSIRALGMAHHVDFVLDSLYPKARVIVWSRNEQVRYGGTVPVRWGDNVVTMGARIAERRLAQTYTVGFLTTDSHEPLPQRDSVQSATSQRGMLEMLVGRATNTRGFIDLHKWRAQSGGAFLDSAIVSGLVGSRAQPLQILKEFDAVLWVDHARHRE